MSAVLRWHTAVLVVASSTVHFIESVLNQRQAVLGTGLELCDELGIAVVGTHNLGTPASQGSWEAGCENTMCESQVDFKCEIEL